MKIKNVKYKKVTIELPLNTFQMLDTYCHDFSFHGGRYFYKDIVNLAICSYLDRHYYDK